MKPRDWMESLFPSLLLYCWLGDRTAIIPIKTRSTYRQRFFSGTNGERKVSEGGLVNPGSPRKWPCPAKWRLQWYVLHKYTHSYKFQYMLCKEIFGSLSTANLPVLTTSAGSVERVATFKLSGINFDASLSWSVHITTITAKPANDYISWNSSRRWVFLPNNFCIFTLLLSARFLSTALALCQYWYWYWCLTSLNITQMISDKAIQKQAIHIIYPSTCGMAYPNVFLLLNWPPLNPDVTLKVILSTDSSAFLFPLSFTSPSTWYSCPLSAQNSHGGSHVLFHIPNQTLCYCRGTARRACQ